MAEESQDKKNISEELKAIDAGIDSMSMADLEAAEGKLEGMLSQYSGPLKQKIQAELDKIKAKEIYHDFQEMADNFKPGTKPEEYKKFFEDAIFSQAINDVYQQDKAKGKINTPKGKENDLEGIQANHVRNQEIVKRSQEIARQIQIDLDKMNQNPTKSGSEVKPKSPGFDQMIKGVEGACTSITTGLDSMQMGLGHRLNNLSQIVSQQNAQANLMQAAPKPGKAARASKTLASIGAGIGNLLIPDGWKQHGKHKNVMKEINPLQKKKHSNLSVKVEHLGHVKAIRDVFEKHGVRHADGMDMHEKSKQLALAKENGTLDKKNELSANGANMEKK